MSGGPFHVVGCPNCTAHWIVEQVPHRYLTECPRCESRYRRPAEQRGDHRRLATIATAETRAEAAAKRAVRLSDRASGIGKAQQFGLEEIDNFAEVAAEVEINGDALVEAADRRLEAETDLNAEALRGRNASRPVGRRADSTVGRPTLELSAPSETIKRRLHRVLVESEAKADPAVAAMETAGLDPEYLADAAAEAVGTIGESQLNGGQNESDDGPVIEPIKGSLQLVHVDNLPATADVVLEDVGPRMSEWLGEWTEATFDETVSTLRSIIDAEGVQPVWQQRVSLALKRCLHHQYGIVATDSEETKYAEVLAEYAAGPRWEQNDRQQDRFEEMLLGIGDPTRQAYDGLDTVTRGPLQVLRYRETPLSTAVQLDTEAWLSLGDRETGIRALKTLGAITQSSRVYLGYDSLCILEELADRFGDYLEMGGVSLVEERDSALQCCSETAPDAEGSAARNAYEWLSNARDGTHAVRLLKTLDRAPDATLTREEIIAHSDVELTTSTFYPVKSDLTDAGLATWESRHGEQSSRLSLTYAGRLAAAHIDGGWRVVDPLQATGETDLIHPHIRRPSTVGSRSTRTGGGEDRPGDGGGCPAGTPARSAETWFAEASAAGFEASAAAGGGNEDAAGDEYVHWLNGPGGAIGAWGMHRRLTAPVTKPGIHLVNASHVDWTQESDSRATFVSDLEVRDGELLVVAQAGVDPLVTLCRLATTLLDARVLAGVATESEIGAEFEQLYEGAWDTIDDVDSVDDFHDVLRGGVQIGWLSDDQQTIEEYRERLQGLRAGLLAELGVCVGLDRGDDRRVELFEDLHGVLASLTQLLWASGRDVIFNLRVPHLDDLLDDELYRGDFRTFFARTVPKQAVFYTSTGWHSWWRNAMEHREEKLEERRPLGLDNTGEVATTLTASWVISGPGVTAFEGDVRGAIDAEVRERPDGTQAAPSLKIPIRDATQPGVLAELIEDIAGEKHYEVARAAVDGTDDDSRGQTGTNGGATASVKAYDPDTVALDDGRADDIARLLRVCLGALGTANRPLAASPFAVAEALLYTAESTRAGDYLCVRDLEYGFSQLPPGELFPELGRVRTSFIQVLLEADDPLRPREIVDRSISEADTLRTWQDAREELLALGIVEERSTGEYAHYTATLEPWWTRTTTSARPPNVDEEMLARDREHEMLFEISTTLGLEVDAKLFAWTGVEPPSTDRIYDAAETLRRWRPMLAAAFADRKDLLDLPPPSTEVVVLGCWPTANGGTVARDEHQQSLSSSCSAGD